MLERINELLWGAIVLVLILGAGIWLTIRTGAAQLRLFPEAAAELCRKVRSRGSGFRALCTALAATVGTGNIAGVAGAIAIGGPGAVFWMWISAFVGMAVKYAESILSVHYRLPDGRAGPMYTIQNGLPERMRCLAYAYSFFGVIAAFGVGNATQINAVFSALEAAGRAMGCGVSTQTRMVIAAALAILTAVMISGGAKTVGNAAEMLIPVVSAAYILLCIGALVIRRAWIGQALEAIVLGAFSPRAVTGGAVGSVLVTLRTGVSRGTFTNEAGMGTAGIAHGAAEVDHPVRQGLMGIMEVFLDTIVICTLTALVILTSGIAIPFGCDAGAELTANALCVCFGPWACALLCGCLVLFALATILGWGVYAARCAEFLFGKINWKLFGALQGAGVILGAVLETGVVWTLAEIVNALMAIPNLIAVMALSGEAARLTREWNMCYNRSHRKNTAR